MTTLYDMAEQVRRAPSSRPPLRSFEVKAGDLRLWADVQVTGRFRPAITQADPLDCAPAEAPEIAVQRLTLLDGHTDVTPLYGHEGLADDIDAQILKALGEEEL